MFSLADDDLEMPRERAAPIPWSEYRALLTTLYTPPLCAKGTASKMRSVLREIDSLGIQTTADLTPVLVSRYIAQRPAAQSTYTLNGCLIVIRTICSYAETAGYLYVSPFRLRKLSKWCRLAPLDGLRHHSKADIRKVLDLMAADVEQRAGWAAWKARRLLFATRLVASTGVRKMEALGSQVCDLDLANQVFWVRPHGSGKRLKTAASEQPVPLPRAFRPHGEEWLAHRLSAPPGFPLPPECPWLIPTVNRRSAWTGGPPGGKALDRLKAVALRAGVSEFTFLSLRHSLATHLEAEGLGEAAISRILRHAPGSRVAKKHYRHADLPNLVDLVSDLDF